MVALHITLKYTQFYTSEMKTLSITYTYIYCISFAPNYVFTTSKLCVNLKTNRVIKKVYNSGCLGYNIEGKFYSLTYLRKFLTKVKSNICPF